MRRDKNDIKAFMHLYDSITQSGKCPTYQESYLTAEIITLTRRPRRFYKNYESFRAARHYHHRRSRKFLKQP